MFFASHPTEPDGFSHLQAIRKKLEQELSKKRGGSARVRQSGKKIAGTVSALRPAQALTVKENMLVIEAAQLMAAKRSDCVLVVDEEEHLSGIFTVSSITLWCMLGPPALANVLTYRQKIWLTV